MATTRIAWETCKKLSSIAIFLSQRPGIEEHFAAADVARARRFLAEKATDLRAAAACKNGLSLVEIGYLWLVVNAPAIDAPDGKSALLALDCKLPRDANIYPPGEWKCDVKEHKGCDVDWHTMDTCLCKCMTVLHWQGPGSAFMRDHFGHFDREWVKVERELRAWFRGHVSLHLVQNCIPPRLVRLATRVFQELYALQDLTATASRVDCFESMIVLGALRTREAKVATQLAALAGRMVSGNCEMFSRGCFRFKCRLMLPGASRYSSGVNGGEQVVSRPEDDVGLLTNELARLGTDENAVYEFVHSLKLRYGAAQPGAAGTSSASTSSASAAAATSQISERAREADPVLLTYAFCHAFQYETKVPFVDSFMFLPEHVVDRDRRDVMAGRKHMTLFQDVPLVAWVGGRAYLWWQNKYIDCDERLDVALVKWIVYARDAYGRAQLQRDRRNDVYALFFNTNFPR